jgi:hypothetical protein
VRGGGLMRAMFTITMLIIVFGLAYFFVVGFSRL